MAVNVMLTDLCMKDILPGSKYFRVIVSAAISSLFNGETKERNSELFLFCLG